MQRSAGRRILGAMRRSSVLLLSLVVLLSSAGCAPVSSVSAQPAACGDVAWGGYGGDPRCAALARRVIHGADRACAADADCSLVHPGASCREQAVATAHLEAYRSQEASCTHPAAGPCSPARVMCSSGCCVQTR